MEKDHVVISLEKYEEIRKAKEEAETKVKLLEQAIMGITTASQKVSPQMNAIQAGSTELLNIMFREAGFRVDFVSKNSIPSLGRGEKVIKIKVE